MIKLKTLKGHQTVIGKIFSGKANPNYSTNNELMNKILLVKKSRKAIEH
jgi:predicted transcriptional regulator